MRPPSHLARSPSSSCCVYAEIVLGIARVALTMVPMTKGDKKASLNNLQSGP